MLSEDTAIALPLPVWKPKPPVLLEPKWDSAAPPAPTGISGGFGSANSSSAREMLSEDTAIALPLPVWKPKPPVLLEDALCKPKWDSAATPAPTGISGGFGSANSSSAREMLSEDTAIALPLPVWKVCSQLPPATLGLICSGVFSLTVWK
jgi:hypothetical protein